MKKQRNEKRNQHAPEGKDQFELDVDRMINEGMAGGTVQSVHGREQIEEAHEIPKQTREK
ncbi:hypothetical protein H0266_06630 [Halobacillus locisalis]|uniref:Uncharacterized protein n=1 Tax=Halobacillus locisalis TaxID=220753 RepID=A0A838CRU2_9BACI|nr:hypothetical protein [Halobacillus locisalis]MBA2174583.1 hypothetical protein [Halobacillus locisalis]